MDKSIIVFHREGPTAFPVAIVTVKVEGSDDPSLKFEKAFELTNTIDHYWAENSGVVPLGCNLRSTSVGDVMQCGPELVIVGSIGFHRIPMKFIEESRYHPTYL